MPAHVLLFYVLLAAAVAAAARYGARPERQVAAMLVAATVLSKVAAWDLLDHFVQFETVLFVIDLLLLAGLVTVALTSDKYWPLWLSACHCYTVVAHLGRLAIPETFAAVYLSNSALMADPGLVILIAGSVRASRRRAACPTRI